MKNFIDTVVAFKLVWVRVLLYVVIPMLTTFLSQTETWSGDTWEHTHWFLKFRLALISALPGFIALAAFIDQSLARAKEDLRLRRVSNGTEILTK